MTQLIGEKTEFPRNYYNKHNDILFIYRTGKILIQVSPPSPKWEVVVGVVCGLNEVDLVGLSN